MKLKRKNEEGRNNQIQTLRPERVEIFEPT